MITDTIKESFRGTTMITIAHRLRTSKSRIRYTDTSACLTSPSSSQVIDYDRVLVLSAGQILENGKHTTALPMSYHPSSSHTTSIQTLPPTSSIKQIPNLDDFAWPTDRPNSSTSLVKQARDTRRDGFAGFHIPRLYIDSCCIL